MKNLSVIIILFPAFFLTIHLGSEGISLSQDHKIKFRVVAFHDGESDQAHASFVREADNWFSEMASIYRFTYESTRDWNNLNPEFLSHYDVVVFLDARPDSVIQRAAFQQYMERGGAWMGFHFAAFALTPSAFPQNWDWYHNQFLGSGQYISNTWRPTSAVLRVEDRKHPATRHLPETFVSSPNEWYKRQVTNQWLTDRFRRRSRVTVGLYRVNVEAVPSGYRFFYNFLFET